MKQLNSFLFAGLLCLNSFSIRSEDTFCNGVENYFQMDENPRGCLHDSKVIKNPLFDILANASYQGCTNNLKPSRAQVKLQARSQSQINNVNLDQCKKVTSCFDEIENLVRANNKALYCSMSSLKSINAKTETQEVINNVRKDIMNPNSSQYKLTQLIHAIGLKVGPEVAKNKIKDCPTKLADKSCLNGISDVELDLVYKVFDQNAISEMNKRVSNSMKGKSSSGRSLGPKAATEGSENRMNAMIPQLFAQMGDGPMNGNRMQMLNQMASFSQDKSLYDEDFIEKLATSLKVNVKKIKNMYFKSNNDEYLYTGPDAKVNYLIDLANAAKDASCNETVWNEEYICAKVVSEFKKDRPNQNNNNEKIAKFVRDNKNLYPNYNDKLIDNLNYTTGFDFNKYLHLSSQYTVCVNNFGVTTFVGKDAEKRYENHRTQMSLGSKELQQAVESKMSTDSKDFARSLSSSDDVTVREFGKKMGVFSGVTTHDDRHETHRLDDKILSTRTQNANSSDQSQSVLNNTRPLDDVSTSSDFKSGISQIGKSTIPNQAVGANSIVTNTDYQTLDANTAVASNQNVIKKITELEEREKALRKKSDDKTATAEESDEMKQLRLQIEDLRTQLAKKDGTDALGNKIVTVKDSPVAVATSSSVAKYPTAINSPGASAVVSRRDNYEAPSERENYSPASRSSFQDSGSAGQDIRSPASTGGRAAVGSGKGSGTSTYGIALTRSGDVTEDLAKIADNPKEADLIIMAEKSNGRPFIIRENGLLVQVVVEKDSAGKAIMENGKPKLKKIKLSKEKEVIIAREFNVVREAKTVRDTVRLQDLRRTTEDAVK